jgi:hypothetical protein
VNSVSADQHIPMLCCSVGEESCNRSGIRLKTRAFSAGLYRSRIIAVRCIEEETLKGRPVQADGRGSGLLGQCGEIYAAK